MLRLPSWIIVLMVGLTALLILIGWEDRHEAGYLPFALGIVFALVTLGAVGAKARGEE